VRLLEDKRICPDHHLYRSPVHLPWKDDRHISSGYVLQLWSGGHILHFDSSIGGRCQGVVGERVSDRELLQRVKASDREAFRDLFGKYQPIVFRQVLFQTRDADAAHDIVQETFLRIWERRGALKPQLSFLAYALRISVNLVRDSARQRRTHERLENMIPPPARSERDDPEEALRLMLLQERLSAAVNDRLPDKCRTVFLLSRFERMGNREIAERLGISVRTVEHQINRALKILRKELGLFLTANNKRPLGNPARLPGRARHSTIRPPEEEEHRQAGKDGGKSD
jgi:RNA polymerase sigma-70 factor (ECF subfamily)